MSLAVSQVHVVLDTKQKLSHFRNVYDVVSLRYAQVNDRHNRSIRARKVTLEPWSSAEATVLVIVAGLEVSDAALDLV